MQAGEWCRWTLDGASWSSRSRTCKGNSCRRWIRRTRDPSQRAHGVATLAGTIGWATCWTQQAHISNRDPTLGRPMRPVTLRDALQPGERLLWEGGPDINAFSLRGAWY